MLRRIEAISFVSSMVFHSLGRDSLCSFMRFFISSSLAVAVAKKTTFPVVFFASLIAYLLLPLLAPPVIKIIFLIFFRHCQSAEDKRGNLIKKHLHLLC